MDSNYPPDGRSLTQSDTSSSQGRGKLSVSFAGSHSKGRNSSTIDFNRESRFSPINAPKPGTRPLNMGFVPLPTIVSENVETDTRSHSLAEYVPKLSELEEGTREDSTSLASPKHKSIRALPTRPKSDSSGEGFKALQSKMMWSDDVGNVSPLSAGSLLPGKIVMLPRSKNEGKESHFDALAGTEADFGATILCDDDPNMLATAGKRISSIPSNDATSMDYSTIVPERTSVMSASVSNLLDRLLAKDEVSVSTGEIGRDGSKDLSTLAKEYSRRDTPQDSRRDTPQDSRREIPIQLSQDSRRDTPQDSRREFQFQLSQDSRRDTPQDSRREIPIQLSTDRPSSGMPALEQSETQPVTEAIPQICYDSSPLFIPLTRCDTLFDSPTQKVASPPGYFDRASVASTGTIIVEEVKSTKTSSTGSILAQQLSAEEKSPSPPEENPVIQSAEFVCKVESPVNIPRPDTDVRPTDTNYLRITSKICRDALSDDEYEEELDATSRHRYSDMVDDSPSSLLGRVAFLRRDSEDLPMRVSLELTTAENASGSHSRDSPDESPYKSLLGKDANNSRPEPDNSPKAKAPRVVFSEPEIPNIIITASPALVSRSPEKVVLRGRRPTFGAKPSTETFATTEHRVSTSDAVSASSKLPPLRASSTLDVIPDNVPACVTDVLPEQRQMHLAASAALLGVVHERNVSVVSSGAMSTTSMDTVGLDAYEQEWWGNAGSRRQSEV